MPDPVRRRAFSRVVRRAIALLLPCIASTAYAEPVTFTVDVPYCTPKSDVVLLRSNRIDPAEFLHDPLTKTGPSTWSGTLEVTTDRAQLVYKYTHTQCDATACPGIEKAITFDGSGAEIADRTLAAGVTEVRDLVYVWRDALTDFDAAGQPIGTRLDPERVAFCAPYLSVSGPGEVTIGYDAFFADPVVLEWGIDAAYGNTVDGGGTHRNHFALSGLEPGREYHYRIIEGGVAGPDQTFRAPVSPGTPFKFALFGDTQFYGEQQRVDHQRFAELTRTFDPDLILSVGDMVASEPGPGGPGGWMFPEIGRWNVFFGVSAPLMAEAPFMAAMGNHEEDAPYFWDVFAFPEPDAPAIDHYDFTYGNVHFTVLYTGSTGGYDREGILESQAGWLESTLTAADANPDIKWKVAFMHRGPYSQGANHPTDGQGFYESGTATRPSWKSLFMQHGVDLVLAGHNHNFTVAHADGMRFVTACSGAPIHDLRTDAIPTTVHAERTCTANFFSVGQNTLSFEAMRPDGTVIEEGRFSLCHDATDCEELPSACSMTTRWSCSAGACEAECVETSDAGIEDAGVPEEDAGAEMDAAVEPDAATPPDAGSPRDANVPRKDAGFFGTKDDEGCGCTAAEGSTVGLFGLVLIGLLLLVRRSGGPAGGCRG